MFLYYCFTNFDNTWRFLSWRPERDAESHTGALFVGWRISWKQCCIVNPMHLRITVMNSTVRHAESSVFGLLPSRLKETKTNKYENLRAQTKAVQTIYGVPVGVKAKIITVQNNNKKQNSRCTCFHLCSWRIKSIMQMKRALSFHLLGQMGGSGWKEN